MATNASTWFYAEPEHNAYLLEERVNHSFWSNRISALHLDCTHPEPPFRMVGVWREQPIAVEWVPNRYFTLTAPPNDEINSLIVGTKEVLGFTPTVSYIDPDGQLVAEWHMHEAEQRIAEIQGNPNYRNIKRYKG
ncbi:MAG: hypothetical protein GYB65_05085 [Chloroflexi bacterium]|nr:hypothetical protein [Chloroflexota bacterium]